MPTLDLIAAAAASPMAAPAALIASAWVSVLALLIDKVVEPFGVRLPTLSPLTAVRLSQTIPVKVVRSYVMSIRL